MHRLFRLILVASLLVFTGSLFAVQNPNDSRVKPDSRQEQKSQSQIQSQIQPTDSEFYTPPNDGSWETVSAEVAGADPELLQKALKFAGDKNSKGVVVLWRGRILAEEYWDGWNQDSSGALNSATKSLVSTLVGMAIEDGHIEGVEQSCSEFLSEWEGRRRHERIQIQHLLSMTGGLRGGKGIFILGFLSKDERAFATRLPVAHRPGEFWEYHNSAYRLLLPIIEEATGISLDDYSQQKLFGPLGMEHARWSRRARNHDEYSLMHMSARDAARFGLLFQRRGKWNGQQLISNDWVATATSPFSETVNPSYGYLWWLNGGDFFYYPVNDEQQQGPIFPGCPDDAYAAMGKDEQRIYVVPSLELVVTRLGDFANGSAPALSEFDAKFLGMICESLKKQK